MDEFIGLIENALAGDTAELAAQRQAVVKDGTWDARARELAALIDSVLRGRRYTYQATVSKGIEAASLPGMIVEGH